MGKQYFILITAVIWCIIVMLALAKKLKMSKNKLEKPEEQAKIVIVGQPEHFTLLKNTLMLNEMSKKHHIHSELSANCTSLNVVGSDSHINNFRDELMELFKSIKKVQFFPLQMSKSEIEDFFKYDNVLVDLNEFLIEKVKDHVQLFLDKDGGLSIYFLTAETQRKAEIFLNSCFVRTEFDLDEYKLQLLKQKEWINYFRNLKRGYCNAITWSNTDTKLTFIGYSKNEENLKQLVENYWKGITAIFKFVMISSEVADVIDQYAKTELIDILHEAADNGIEIKLIKNNPDGGKPYFQLVGKGYYMDYFIEKLNDLSEQVVNKRKVAPVLVKKVLNDELLMHDICSKHQVIIRNVKAMQNLLEIEMDLYALRNENIESALKDMLKIVK